MCVCVVCPQEVVACLSPALPPLPAASAPPSRLCSARLLLAAAERLAALQQSGQQSGQQAQVARPAGSEPPPALAALCDAILRSAAAGGFSWPQVEWQQQQQQREWPAREGGSSLGLSAPHAGDGGVGAEAYGRVAALLWRGAELQLQLGPGAGSNGVTAAGTGVGAAAPPPGVRHTTAAAAAAAVAAGDSGWRQRRRCGGLHAPWRRSGTAAAFWPQLLTCAVRQAGASLQPAEVGRALTRIRSCQRRVRLCVDVRAITANPDIAIAVGVASTP